MILQRLKQTYEMNLERICPYRIATFISRTLSDGELQSLWSKAFQLSKTKVLKAPGSDGNTWWVSSDSSPSPHIVTKSKTNTGR